MHASKSVRIPEVLHYGDGDSGGSFIVMEFLRLSGRADAKLFGRKMAMMHLATPLAEEAQQGKFGFDVPNTIGGTAQAHDFSARGSAGSDLATLFLLAMLAIS
eukprot:6184321-Pleurochrysis_carterae.AAC.2